MKLNVCFYGTPSTNEEALTYVKILGRLRFFICNNQNKLLGNSDNINTDVIVINKIPQFV